MDDFLFGFGKGISGDAIVDGSVFSKGLFEGLLRTSFVVVVSFHDGLIFVVEFVEFQFL